MNTPSHDRRHFQVVESFFNTLTRAGITSFVVSPGSRSTPLAIYAAREQGASLHVLIDERSASFFALGLAKGSGRPAVLICTSGTAAANYFPAVVEAYYSRTPLIVLTADRPPELQDVGAAQTIDQIGLYGNFVKWSAHMPLPEENEDVARYFNTVASRAVTEALTGPTGPVHVNFPFREPLIPPPPVADTDPPQEAGLCRPVLGSALPRETILSSDRTAALVRDLLALERGVLVCGPRTEAPGLKHLQRNQGAGRDEDVGYQALRLASALGIPVLADPLSQLRYGLPSAHEVIDGYDVFLRDEAIREALRPDYIIRIGDLPTSKPLNTFLRDSRATRHIVVDPNGWNDSLLSATDMLRVEPAHICRHLADVIGGRNPIWRKQWEHINDLTRRAVNEAVLSLPGLFEGRIFTELAHLLPDDSVLFVGNSMPVRDLDTFLGSTRKPLSVMANRGANGIDGIVSTALGVAASTQSAQPKPLVLVVGDLSFLHDLGGLLAARACRSPVVIIVVNNDGGGIFSFLPQAKHVDDFESLFGTPHGLNFSHAAAMFGLPHAIPRDWREFHITVNASLRREGVSIVEVSSNRSDNYTMHRQVIDRALEVLSCSWTPTE